MASHQPRPPAPQESPAGPLRPPTMLQPFVASPRCSKTQEMTPIGVGRPKCPTNKNNDKIYQMKQ
jgi:hypothetical protein